MEEGGVVGGLLGWGGFRRECVVMCWVWLGGLDSGVGLVCGGLWGGGGGGCLGVVGGCGLGVVWGILLGGFVVIDVGGWDECGGFEGGIFVGGGVMLWVLGGGVGFGWCMWWGYVGWGGICGGFCCCECCGFFGGGGLCWLDLWWGGWWGWGCSRGGWVLGGFGCGCGWCFLGVVGRCGGCCGRFWGVVGMGCYGVVVVLDRGNLWVGYCFWLGCCWVEGGVVYWGFFGLGGGGGFLWWGGGLGGGWGYVGGWCWLGVVVFWVFEFVG
uniref:Uncharacterized protein n=1 Tax=Knipowitschia caucasica TaxID=637954 RepID=A0AAV2KIU4_KNICA